MDTGGTVNLSASTWNICYMFTSSCYLYSRTWSFNPFPTASLSTCAKMCNGFSLMYGEVTMDLCDVTGVWCTALSFSVLSNLHRWVGEEDKCCPGVLSLATDKRIPHIPQYIQYPHSPAFCPPFCTPPAPGNVFLGGRTYLWGYSKPVNIIWAIWGVKEILSKCLLWT